MLYKIKNPKQHLRIEANGAITGLTKLGKNTISELKLNQKEAISFRYDELLRLIQWFEKQLKSFLNVGQNAENNQERKLLLEITFRSYIKDMEGAATYNLDRIDERGFVFANAYWYFNKLIVKNGNFLQSEQDLLRLVETLLIKKENINEGVILQLIERIEKEKKTGTLQYGYLKNLTIRKYFTLEHIHLKGLSRTKEVYFLGENGDGKTLLLQAIVLAFLKQHIEKQADKGDVGQILQNIADNKNLFLSAKDDKNNRYGKSKAILKNVYAYGTRRHSNTDTEKYDREGYLTLFHTEKSLISPVTWLQQIQLRGKKSVVSLEDAKKMLSELLNGEVAIETDLEIVRFRDIRFGNTQTTALRFEQLSDGYKSVMTWVADLVARMAENQPEAKGIRDFKGIVLVDEVGLHLHPKWEAKLVERLRTWFPKVQFFFTTHSPILILNASQYAVFYRLYKEDGVTKISQKFYCKDFSDRRLNSIVTSSLFGLETSSMRIFNPEVDDVDTSEDEISYQLRKKIDERIQQVKAEKKITYLSPDFLSNLIDDVLNEDDF